MLMAGAEPFFQRGGPVGALLIHGFTGTPREVRPVGDALAAEGHTVLGVRLAQHATQPQDMFRSHWRDWYAAVLDGYWLLRGQCEMIFAIGLSMGGALALCLAADAPLAGVAVLATPSLPFVNAMGWRARYARWISYGLPFARKGPPSPTGDPLHLAYPQYPVRAIPQLRMVVTAAAEALPRITAPALVIHSHGDEAVPDANAEYILAHLGSAQKELVWLERSGHILPEDVEREVVFDRLRAFVRADAPLPTRP
ncbi:MAG: alpha/beta fold hydrolase [Anaerolineales bacterium]|nr:alpha/beta fold hydrolase [Anaerolineales bacterium]